MRETSGRKAMKITAILLGVFCLGALARAQDRICFEAESAAGITAPMEAVTADSTTNEAARQAAGSASGGKYLEIAEGKGCPPKVTAGEAQYTIEIPEEGTYALWCRVWWEDSCGNSFRMNLDAEPPFIFGEDAVYKTWHWVKAPADLKQLKLSRGTHTLTVRNREDGVRIDQILLTRDAKLVPVDIEETTVPAAPPPP